MTRAQRSDSYELLSTKFALPRLHLSLLPRERLQARIREGLDRKLTLLSAPAGFGKTTLVAEWLTNQHYPVAWVSLDGGDNDAVRFWRYVITACQSFGNGTGQAALDYLQAPRSPSFERLLTRFINDLTALPQQSVLVLEDYEVITAPQIHEALTFLLEHVPATLHVIILTRRDPPLPLARWRARDELNELRAEDLRFSRTEVEAFFQQAVKFALSPKSTADLESRTEGWAAGLRLIALALQERKTPEQMEHFLATLTGGHRPILEYLIGDVFLAQPEAIQSFLLQTSFLGRLTADLCDAVTGRDDSQAVLEQLESSNLFLVSLDGARQWYRYHALFAEAMQHYAQQHLTDDLLRGLHERASGWYEEHGFLGDAVESGLAARLFSRAADLIQRAAQLPSFQNELHTFRRWIEQLPKDALHANPSLCFTAAMILLFSSDRRDPATAALLEDPLRAAEQKWRAVGDQDGLGRIFALRSSVLFWQGDFAQSFDTAKQALELLPEFDLMWRGTALIHAATGELLSGRTAAARQQFGEARTLCEACGQIHGVLAATLMLGDVLAAQGEPQQAEQHYEQVLAGSEQIEVGEPEADRGETLVRLGELAYQWNDLPKAEQAASEALQIGKLLGADDLIARSGALLTRLYAIRGDYGQAQSLLDSLLLHVRWELPQRDLFACQMNISLMAGDIAGAQHWAAAIALRVDFAPLIQQEKEALLQARLLLAQGKPERALALLDYWFADAQAQGRVLVATEILILKALAFSATGERRQAREACLQAVLLAQPRGYQRFFLDEGEAIVPLLRDLLNVESAAPYTSRLLAALAQDLQESPAPGEETLTAQEQRVIRLLGAGLSNTEIAEELTVSVNTVKTHVKNIYRKLNITSRDEVKEAARRYSR